MSLDGQAFRIEGSTLLTQQPIKNFDRPIRVLLVDDERVDRAAVLRALEQGGLAFEAVEAHDIESARAALSEGPYDCVLVDAALPGGDGQRVIEQVARLGDMPAIVLTVNEQEALAREAVAPGAADYLPRSRATAERLVGSILHVLRAQTLQRREAEARRALAHHTRRLQALVDGSARIHAAPSVEEVVVAAAVEALVVFDACEARIETAARARLPAGAHTATAAEASRPRGEEVVRDLLDAKGTRVGSLTLVGVVLEDTDVALLAQFVRTAVSALENAWLLRVATDASLARDEVLAVVSHDMRSPLSTVSLGAGMLRTSLAARGRPLADDVEVVRRIERACQRMSRLIDNLLDAAQLDVGTFVVTPRPRDAAKLVHEAVDAAVMPAEAARVTVRAQTLDALRVMADRERVLQLFSNLIGNALKFTPGGGEVTLSVERHGKDARFTVTDTGPGIADEHLPLLFERYWKSEGTGGRGLGLYISRGIVEAHGGRIEVRNVPGGGSAFTFTLPLAP